VTAATIEGPLAGSNDRLRVNYSTSATITMTVFATDNISVPRPLHSLICIPSLAGHETD